MNKNRKILLSLSPMPPFVGLSIELDPSLLVGRFIRNYVSLDDAASLLSWALPRILEDQFRSGDAAGAWAHRYPEYLQFLYGDALPTDVSIRDTITFSAWNALALESYRRKQSNDSLGSAIAARVDSYREYLHRHYDPKVGGFGLRKRVKSDGSAGIDVDVRHTVWAALSLWHLEVASEKEDEMLRKSCAFVRDFVARTDGSGERSITYAVLHQLVTTPGLSTLVSPTDLVRTRLQKKIEAILISAHDRRTRTWDTEYDPQQRAQIDNALFVLYSVRPSTCVDRDLRGLLLSTARHLLTHVALKVADDHIGVPFEGSLPPNIGTTAQLLWSILRDDNSLEIARDELRALARFIADPRNRNPAPDHHCYSWQLASLFALAAADA